MSGAGISKDTYYRKVKGDEGFSDEMEREALFPFTSDQFLLFYSRPSLDLYFTVPCFRFHFEWRGYIEKSECPLIMCKLCSHSFIMRGNALLRIRCDSCVVPTSGCLSNVDVPRHSSK